MAVGECIGKLVEQSTVSHDHKMPRAFVDPGRGCHGCMKDGGYALVADLDVLVEGAVARAGEEIVDCLKIYIHFFVVGF